MIIYNVTINLDDGLNKEWLDYMRNEHIPDVMKTGCFTSYRICELLTRQTDETGTTYSIQYTCDSMDKYNEYQEEYAAKLQQEHSAKYGGRFVAFRSLMAQID